MTQLGWIYINAALCIGIMIVSVCRINAMDNTVLFRVFLEYAFFLTAAFVSLVRPFIGESVGWATVMLEAAVLASFFTSMHAWRRIDVMGGKIDMPPESARSDVAPLGHLPEINR